MFRRAISFADFKDVYLKAYRDGCKGCTTYRPNDVTGAVLFAVRNRHSPPSLIASDEPELPLPLPETARGAAG